jgi:hydrogenase maturation factor
VERALRRFESLTAADFDVIVTRDDDGIAPKPAPDGVLHAAAAMGVPAAETLVVGDFLLDMQAGRAAGAVTAFLLNHGAPGDGEADEPDAADCDFVVGRLPELMEVVRLGLPLARGKLPNERLAAFLAGLPHDPALVVPPAVGEDVAAVDLGGAELLVMHGDPITLGGHDVGAAAVLVNVNDIAAAGAEPRWLLATVLLPPDTTPSEAGALLESLASAAVAAGVTLAGGHTEVTDAVTRPVVSLTALGTVGRAELKDKRSARSGDRVLLTKALAVEGAALLAEELGELLRARGMSPEELDACRALQAQASILPEALVAREAPGVRALHDVTEGGLATALRELAAATGRGVLVHRDRVPVSPETERICALLGADPLGLIASGSLLVCCDPAEAADVIAALEAAGVPATDIGELTEEGAGVVALERDRPAHWPEFATDEAARLLARYGTVGEEG